jgi:DHA2 family multidrug resistance protein
LSVVGIALFIWQELRVEHPAVDLRVLRHRSLAAGSIISLAVGMGLYGTVFVVPVFAQTVLQFTATKTGLMLVPGALASAVAMFALAPLIKIFSPRLMIATGCLITIGVMFAFTQINPDTGSDQLYWPLIWRGFGTVIMFLPLSIATLGSLPKKDVASGAGFFSLTRQLGGSIGIAAITTLVAKQQFVHRAQLVYDASDLNPAYQERLSADTSYFNATSATRSPATTRRSPSSTAPSTPRRPAELSRRLLLRRPRFFLTLPLILLLGKGRETTSTLPEI